MDEISRPQLALYAVIVVVIGLLGARYLAHGGGASSASSASSGNAGTQPGASSPRPVSVGASAGQPAVVDVTGAVRRPGVFRLRAGARVLDAVRRAGGTTRRADLSAVNLAAKVSDGAQILVPARGQAAASAAAPGGAAAPAQPVDLNTATPEQLDALDGVGPATAKKIVAYRQQHGGFGSVGELDRIPGIGAKKIAALRSKVRV